MLGKHLKPFVILAFAGSAVGLLSQCARPEVFPELGMKVASPIDTAVTDDGLTYFVLNADLDRTYNAGSILVIDKDGTKKAVVATPRLGRSLTVAGNDLIATFDHKGDEGDGPGQVTIYDISTPTAPVLKTSFDVHCSPMNSVLRSGYKYFAVTCASGELFVGELTTDRTQSSLTLVRDYTTTRRAMFLDPNRGLLLLFPTKLGNQLLTFDRVFDDAKTYDDKFVAKDGPNEIPDDFENNRANKGNLFQREQHSLAVYNISAEAAKGFPFGDITTDDAVKSELHYLYFTLRNFDGVPDPDSDAGVTNFNRKFYRTNFWEAKPDPTNPDAFFVSQRGVASSTGVSSANNVIKISILGDLTSATAKTSDLLSFDRIYGFNGELDNKSYPGDFEFSYVSGQPVLLVNHFRDISRWRPADTGFGLTARGLSGNLWRSDLREYSAKRSYYQISAGKSGRFISAAYYGNAVYMFDVDLATGIKAVGDPIE